jgi:hypothetical protein
MTTNGPRYSSLAETANAGSEWDGEDRRSGMNRRYSVDRRDYMDAWDYPLIHNRRRTGDRRCGYDRRR